MAADVALRIACFVVFSDSCLGLRGAAPVGRSLFDYPQSLLIAATGWRRWWPPSWRSGDRRSDVPARRQVSIADLRRYFVDASAR
ncbi:MAG: hypothetical protein J0I01_16990 [Stenotrophomonas nitritireducens]|uniref:hypothetical protein n=1 Tax=Stenotrophomonas nitritireducens TaxID=83617 RepID=UPI001AC62F74|nr:hypothetical protein [Stenotrophomonas nitritireducens]MBN8769554.1 hypothetical protein [Stenotrophomonas sp.]MBN8793923.1 hypothetical protein [Stenotrophomonas nitritireducens]